MSRTGAVREAMMARRVARPEGGVICSRAPGAGARGMAVLSASRVALYEAVTDQVSAPPLTVCEAGSPHAPKPRLLDQVREALRAVRSPADRMFLS